MGPALLADLIVIVHLLYIGFVVGGELAVIVGALFHWRWIRNPVFRVTHLLAILVVAINALTGVLCPLTQWESALRRRAGQPVEEISFVGRLVRELLYYQLPEWVFTTTYVVFALLVIATLVLVPPRWRWRGRD
ncbi:MAG: DUF2784 domain-containing protein [Planctomycetota bacterium]|jgi:hypothetical protein